MPKAFSRLAWLALAASLAFAPAAGRAADYEAGVLAFDRADYAAALRQFRALSVGGHAGAEFMLGAMYFYGHGVTRDDGLAAIWFFKAAAKGHASAQLAYGSLHIRGVGVSQDLEKAFMWLTIAAETGEAGLRQQAIKLRDQAERFMQPAEVQAARQLAAAWRPTRAGLSTPNPDSRPVSGQ